MKLQEFCNHLTEIESLNFIQIDGSPVPSHFHITEAGLTTKHFVDCGGTIRVEKTISMQLWTADDTEHRLTSKKLLGIISIAEHLWAGEDLDIEIEYQAETIGRYGVEYSNGNFILTPKFTNCLALDKCGIPDAPKKKIRLSELQTIATQSCAPGSGCC
jgi:hypothetical protein